MMNNFFVSEIYNYHIAGTVICHCSCTEPGCLFGSRFKLTGMLIRISIKEKINKKKEMRRSTEPNKDHLLTRMNELIFLFYRQQLFQIFTPNCWKRVGAVPMCLRAEGNQYIPSFRNLFNVTFHNTQFGWVYLIVGGIDCKQGGPYHMQEWRRIVVS